MSNVDEHNDFVKSKDSLLVDPFAKHKIDVNSSRLELLDYPSLSFIELFHTPLFLRHSIPQFVATSLILLSPPILGVLNYKIVGNDFDQNFEQTMAMGFKDLSDYLGHVESLRMSIHDNCDIFRPLSSLSITCVVIYVAKDWASKFDKLKRVLTYVDACLYFYFS